MWTTPTYQMEAYTELLNVKIDEVRVSLKGSEIFSDEKEDKFYGFRLHVPDNTVHSGLGLKTKNKKPPLFFGEDANAQKEWCIAIRETISEYTKIFLEVSVPATIAL